MTNEVVEMIQNRLIYDGTMIRSSLIFMVPGTLTAIILLQFGLNRVFNRYYVTGKSQRLIKLSCIILILMCSTTQLLGTEGNRLIRLFQLRQDLKKEAVTLSYGVVEDIYPYEKGGNAVTINGQRFYIMSGIGNMKTGMEFQFKYLESSKFIVAFEVEKDTPIPKNANVPESMLWRFSSDSYEAIKNVYQVDDLAFKYVENYYKILGTKEHKIFLDNSWTIYSYYIKNERRYRSNFESEQRKIFIIIDALSGKPIYFWTDPVLSDN